MLFTKIEGVMHSFTYYEFPEVSLCGLEYLNLVISCAYVWHMLQSLS